MQTDNKYKVRIQGYWETGAVSLPRDARQTHNATWANPMPARLFRPFTYKFVRFVKCFNCQGKATLWEYLHTLYIYCACPEYNELSALGPSPKMIGKMPEDWKDCGAN